MNEIHIEVENIKCAGCISSIRNAILKHENVEEVVIDKEHEEVIITTNEGVREEFVELLTSLGYPEKGNNTLFRKAKSYVSCAVGRMNQNEN
jgi:cation transport ATPase